MAGGKQGWVIPAAPRPCAECHEQFTPSIVTTGANSPLTRMCQRCVKRLKAAKKAKKMQKGKE